MYEKKSVLLFFVYNKIDDFLKNKIKSKKGKFNNKRSFDDQFTENEIYLKSELEKLKNELFTGSCSINT